jgi:hypothetical protein
VFKQNSPDAKIISAEKYTDPDKVFAKAEELKRKGGPEWQPLHGDDFALTTRRVRKLAQQYADVAKRVSGGLVDARGNPVLTLDERSALMKDEPLTKDHVVADELAEAKAREAEGEGA